MDNLVGKRLDGRYELHEIIGVGGMAVVYKAYDSIDDRTVAVKILKEEFVGSDEFRRRFKNESKAIAVLSHPNIVKVYDVSFGDNLQYIVMEYINGIPLKRFIERRGVLTHNDAVHFTLQILRALQHAHEKGIVHRDIKPQNIMLLQDGTIKVTDFGIARFSRSERRTMTDQAIGSVHYISPEQARGDFTDGKADIYSVGVMLYEMLTGRVPFEADSPVSVAIMQLQSDPVSPRSLNPLIPLGLEQITLRAMQKNPQMRYRSAAEMLLDLEDFQRNPEMTFSYDYYVDDSPTKYVTGAKANTGSIPPEGEGAEDEYGDEDEAQAKAPLIPILAGVAAAFVLVLCLIGFFVWKFLINPGTKPEFVMPNLIGQDYNKVVDDKAYAKYEFKFEIQAWDSSEEFAANQIIWQDPEKGDKVKSGATVNIRISTGPKLTKVPNVSEYDREEAISTLEGLGFVVTPVNKSHQTVPVGHVIETNPAKDSQIPTGSEILLYVSTGPEAVYVDVPDVRNLFIDEAKSELNKKGLVASVTEVDSTVKKGVVLSQSPERGQLKQGSSVKLTVSTGKAPVVTRTASFTLKLPDEYQSKSIYISAVLNNKKVFTTTAPVILGEEEEVDVSFETTLESGKISIVFTETGSSDTQYKWVDFEYDFVKNEIKDETVKEYDLPKEVFPRKSDSSSSSSSSPGFPWGYSFY